MIKILWNVFVSVLLLIAIIGDIEMALNTQRNPIDIATEKINTNEQHPIINNINTQDILLKEITKESF